MRIGTKLLLTYLLLISLVGAATILIIPRWVTWTVTAHEQQRLTAQVQGVARQLTTRMRPPQGGQGGFNLQQTLQIVENILTDEIVAVVNPEGIVTTTNAPELRRRRLPMEQITALTNQPTSAARSGLKVDGLGTVLAAVAPLNPNDPSVRGFQVVMLREITYAERLAAGLTRWLLMIVLGTVAAALLVVGMVSREMATRLRQTGQAARALAEGDLNQRAPQQGSDEIADMAGHFNHMAERIQALVEGLRRSEQGRRTLLAMASHEIRTPLTSIHGFAEALRDGVVPTDAKRQRYYEIITSESARLSRMVDDLFDVAKLGAGQAELNLQEMTVAPWLTEFAESFRPVTDSAPPTLRVAVAPELAATRIWGDRDRLNQVLFNLCANAARFTPAGDSITIRATREGDDLVVAVIDRGPGIPPDEAANLFETFYQGRNNGHGHKGAGLGLAIVKSLVEAHGGTLGVQSIPGQGATFWFRLKRLP